MIFHDRLDAGRRLATRLNYLRGQDVVVLGLPRGGVPLAFEVAKELGAPLDLIVVRKLGVPFQPELAMGALGEGGVLVTNDEIVRMAGISPDQFAQVLARERGEVTRRAERFRGDHPAVPLSGRIALIVDDGIATGSTAQAACKVARALGAAKVILAVPVGAADSIRLLSNDADEVICLHIPKMLSAVGEWYEDFSATSDEEVVNLLREAAKIIPSKPNTLHPVATPNLLGRDEEIEVVVGSVHLAGHLVVPEGAIGMVIFAHGSGSSRNSPRNRAVAAALNKNGLATLLFDLLTPAEESDRSNVFDIELLAGRLLDATRWLDSQTGLANLPVGYFGASTGAAAALWAAADPTAKITAVVSRGGRADLAGSRLSQVRAATLLIVGGRDEVVIELNRQAEAQLHCESQLVVVPGATHLFEEPGTLERVAELASDWFITHLRL
ncbi:MAG: alpha/beta family hydrolase [Actinomycetota bacterium]